MINAHIYDEKNSKGIRPQIPDLIRCPERRNLETGGHKKSKY